MLSNLRKQLSGYFGTHDRGWVLSLLVSVFIVYLYFLGNPFIFDDSNFFSRESKEILWQPDAQFGLRWLANATLTYTYEIFSGEYTYIYHLENTLLHVFNVIVLFYLLRQILVAVKAECDSAAIVRGAWAGALIFAVHPVAVYAVGYVIERSILMATMFTLLMQLAYVRGLLNNQKRWLVLAILFYVLACYSKEHSVLAPLLLVGLIYILREKNLVASRILWLTSIAFFSVAVWITLCSKGVLGSPYEVTARQLFEQQNINASVPMLHLLSALTQAGLFFKYLLLWLLPNVAWMSIDLRVPFVSTEYEWSGWFWLLAFFAYGFVALKLLLRRGTSSLIGFALLYPWVQFGVELSGIRVQEPFVLYRSYLWMPGVMLLASLVVIRLSKRQLILAATCMVLILIPLAWNRLWVFSDNFRLWDEAKSKLPNNIVAGADRIRYNRAHYAAKLGLWNEAIPDYEFVTRIDPYIAIVHNDLGVAYFNTRRLQEAIVQFDSAQVLDPNFASTYYNKGMALKMLHKDDQALEQMEEGCKLGNVLACAIVKMQHLQVKSDS